MRLRRAIMAALVCLMAPLPFMSSAAVAARPTPALSHPAEGRENCTACHQVGKTGVGVPYGTGIPDDHASRPDSICLGCHSAPAAKPKPVATAQPKPAPTQTVAPKPQAEATPANGTPPRDGRRPPGADTAPVESAASPAPPGPAASASSTDTAPEPTPLPAPAAPAELPSAGEEDQAAVGIIFLIAAAGLLAVGIATRGARIAPDQPVSRPGGSDKLKGRRQC